MKTPKPAKSDGRGAQDGLIDLMARYRLTLPRNAADWRRAYGKDGADVTGELPGIASGKVKLLCTDGLLAWFLLGDGETVLWGHLANFVEDKPDKQPREAGMGRQPRSAKGVALALEFLTQSIDSQQ